MRARRLDAGATVALLNKNGRLAHDVHTCLRTAHTPGPLYAALLATLTPIFSRWRVQEALNAV